MDEGIRDKLESLGQAHVLKFFAELNDEHRSQLTDEIGDVNWKELNQVYKDVIMPQVEKQQGGESVIQPGKKIDDSLIEALSTECIEGTTKCNKDQLESYRQVGLSNISQGKVAALLLAGGQGTRLGFNYPKGMFDVGLPEHKSLYQLQAERIIELVKSAEDSSSQEFDALHKLIWYIMTSEATMEVTRDFFEKHNFFGVPREKVIFFEQNTIPSIDFQGKVFLKTKYKISQSPNGNGGLYEALHGKNIIEHMKSNGVEYVHVYCVDNILVRVCDPAFMGYCINKGVEVGAKIVEKVQPNESVGIICKVANQFRVIEYSEISDEIANKRDEKTGKLSFNAGNICEHFFTVEFLDQIKGDKALDYHIAVKKIPHIDLETGEQVNPDKPNGIKLEKFVFDVFKFTEKFAAWQVEREDEFSPLKNGMNSATNNAKTALESLLRAYKLGVLTK